MPSVDEMMADLDTADKAGDAQLATHIAGLIKAQQGGAGGAPPPADNSPFDPTGPDVHRASAVNGGVSVYMGNQTPADGSPTNKAFTQGGQPARQTVPITRDQTGLGPEAVIHTPLGDLSSDQVTSAAESMGHNMLGVGDVVGGVGRMAAQALGGQPVDYQTAENQYQAQRNFLAQKHPIANLAGGLAGAVDTGVVGGAGLKATGLVTPVTNALAATEGQVVGNIAKMGLGAAAAGATQGAAQGAGETTAAGGNAQQVAQAAVQGGAGGAATGGVLGPVAGVAAPQVAKVFAPLATKTAAALGKLMGEDPNEVASAWSAFQQSTGRSPTMAELASIKAQADIKRAASQNPVIGEKLVGAQDAADQARVTSMQGQVAPPNPTGAAAAENATTAQGNIDYPAARAHNFNISTTEDANLGGISPADHTASSILDQTGVGTADKVRIRNDLQHGVLSGEDAQLIQSKLADKVRTTHSPSAESALADLQDFLSRPSNEDANAALETARSNFAAGKSAAEGTALGQQIVKTNETPEYLAKLAGQTDAQAVATPQGVATGLHTAAQTPAGAIGLAKSLATDTGLHARLTASLGQDTADALRDMGAKETAAADALSAVTPRTPAPESGKDNDAIMTGIHGLAAVASHGVWFKALHAVKAISGAGMSDDVASKVAQYLADPSMTGQGIALLRKAGLDNAALRQLSLSAAAQTGAVAGTTSADLAGQ